MADAGLYSYELFTAFTATCAGLAWRIGASVSVGPSTLAARRLLSGADLRPRTERPASGPPGQAGKRRPRIPADLARLVRVVEYTVPDRNPDGELIAVVTTIIGPHEVSRSRPGMRVSAAMGG
jgi:hypothetical protein